MNWQKLFLSLVFVPLPFADEFRIEDYQVGSQWQRDALVATLPLSAWLGGAVKSAPQINSATAFYLGKFGNEHYVATNAHVCPSAFNCALYGVQFPLPKKNFKMKLFLGAWPEIDLALLILEVAAEDEVFLEQARLSLARDLDYSAGRLLATLGYGRAGQDRGVLSINADDDCRIFSPSNQFTALQDPDTLNPYPHLVWSFAHGCDISHGDSGSMILDRETGTLLGWVWTGRFPKSKTVQDSETLRLREGENSEWIWSELNYAVPAEVAFEVLEQKLEDGGVREYARPWVRELLENIR